ncbi:MAG: tRNA uridine-5-carboxymethylaminomethyl(34) synthesis GTPase MnmE [Lachnospiraceae bacterium]|nr:tRNA uridine-5-carboxymethylaminomethyl(34) synthesis GTPase MnmE [Lachnospiraceae bacterium]
MYSDDTIAAIATALSESGIGIIRVSGSMAKEITNKIFVGPSGKRIIDKMQTHTIKYGYVISLDSTEDSFRDNIIDECLVSYMQGPKSFTGEDVVEINCHGGVFVVKKVLSEVLRAGARLADPGEFSKRAFLNGRMDLTEAEAVMDIISSKSDSSLKASINQLSGNISKKIKELREDILYNIAFIESALDDPEHISLDGYDEKITGLLEKWIYEIDKLIRSNDSGKFLREGINTVLLGKPNAGKSSVMNLLLGQDRAIVTDIAGTTRDTLEEYIKFGNIGLNLVDTAGIRDTENTVEQIGVDRARKAAENADLIIYVVDSTDLNNNITKGYIDLMNSFSNKKGIVLLNKVDLGKNFEKIDFPYPVIEFSTVTGEGFDILKDTITDMFYKGLGSSSDEIVITNIRHRNLLEDCKKSLVNVQQSVSMGMQEDFYSIDLMDAYSSLGKIIGEEIEDDLATEIFSKFCLGK